ncbi:ribosome hibernation protein YhbH [Klebsiella pneumoniae]|uniref:Ribosome hibernation protein YhbH n=1 Tax=Klebsiella pneumoniae TaxID=573 RepID=A0A377XG14_KLEPN|nr:ribosome hibernation protein YhbH [Klebsiella pneumoniae]
MQLNITGHNVEITPAMREFVTAKFSKLEQFFDRINQVYIVLKVEKVTQIADANLHVTVAKSMPVRKGRICMRLSMVLSTSWQDS